MLSRTSHEQEFPRMLQVVHDLAGWKVRTIACGSGTYALAAGVPGDPDNSTVTWCAPARIACKSVSKCPQKQEAPHLPPSSLCHCSSNIAVSAESSLVTQGLVLSALSLQEGLSNAIAAGACSWCRAELAKLPAEA